MARNRMHLGSMLLAVALGSSPARAELLYFKDGGRLHVAAEVRDGEVRIKGATEEYVFPTGDFLKIVPGHNPEREWPARREAALKSGAEARFAAASWALENGLVPQSVAMLRAAHSMDGAHQPTARLVELLDGLDRPAPDPDSSSLLKAIGISLEVARSRHVVLYHERSRTEADAQLDLLERVLTAYYLTFAADGLDLELPDEKLVFVALNRQSDYLAFLRSQHAGAFSTTYGYYHPAFRAVVTFDLRTAPRWASAVRGFDRARSALPIASSSPDALDDPTMRNLQRQRVLQEMEIRANTDGTVAHELIHALTRASGLSPAAERFPQWLHEGLAAQFEVVRGGRWAGVGQAHDLRLGDWRKVEAASNLEGLIRDRGFGQGYKPSVYARSWAAVAFLRHARSSQFLEFLERLEHPPDRASAQYFATRFCAAFGSDLTGLEAEMTRYFRGVKTPLEESAPETPGLCQDARD
jgi:Protein of unknown function (DUF1570)